MSRLQILNDLYLSEPLNVFMPLFAKFRQESGLTIEELAEKINVPPDYLQKLENGENTFFYRRAFRALCSLYHQQIEITLVDSEYYDVPESRRILRTQLEAYVPQFIESRRKMDSLKPRWRKK